MAKSDFWLSIYSVTLVSLRERAYDKYATQLLDRVHGFYKSFSSSVEI